MTTRHAMTIQKQDRPYTLLTDTPELTARANSHATAKAQRSCSFDDEDPKAHLAVEDGAPPGRHHWPAATFHMVTQMIGAGVLALPRAFATLGWVFGPTLLALFGVISFLSVRLLAEVYDRTAKRSRSYKDCVLQTLGKPYYRCLVAILYLKLFLNAVGYTVAGGTSIKYLARTLCTSSRGEAAVYYPGGDACASMQQSWVVMPMFLSLQLVLNALPDMESIWWVSMVGAAASYVYSGAALALAWAQLAGAGPAPDTSLLGNAAAAPSAVAAAMAVFQALGNVLFAWTCATLAPSIQSTLREPPASELGMKKALSAAFGSTAACYFAVAAAGYAAVGAAAPGDILTGFDADASTLAVLGNAAVLLHMVSVVQLFSAPAFEFIEELMAAYVPALVQPKPTLLLTRLVYRGVYLGTATVCAASAPFFALVGGLVGALSFFPIQVFFPYMMHAALVPPAPRRKLLMLGSAALVGATCVLCVVASVHGIAAAMEGELTSIH